MRRLLPALLLLSALPAAASTKWNDTLRDVYVNGALTRDGQTLVHEHQMAWLPPGGGEAWILDRDTHETATVERSVFTFNDDRTSATTPDVFPTQKAGALATPDDTTWLFNNVLIYPHQSFAGPMSEETLWSTAPVWKSIHDHYTPDANAVAQLRAAKPARVTIVFATWCGDSKRAVPRLLKALHEANNPALQVELFGIGPDFLTPLSYIRERKLTNVPTVIVERGKEIGRMVETPATATVEQDVAMIVSDQPLPPHRGRYERTSLIASGHYELRDARGETSAETWELYSTKDDGLLVHSLIVPAKTPSRTVETFAALDVHRHPDFVEVTRRDGEHVVRTRASSHDGKWTVRSRGDERGLSEQTLVAPEVLVLPATLTYGWPLFGMDRQMEAFVLDERAPIGAIETVHVAADGSGILPLTRKAHPPSHRVAARSLRYVVSTESVLYVPVRVQLEDGSERRLVDMTGTLPRALPAAYRD
jgi:thiol-disulfide isomerase/thioredoxin